MTEGLKKVICSLLEKLLRRKENVHARMTEHRRLKPGWRSGFSGITGPFDSGL